MRRASPTLAAFALVLALASLFAGFPAVAGRHTRQDMLAPLPASRRRIGCGVRGRARRVRTNCPASDAWRCCPGQGRLAIRAPRAPWSRWLVASSARSDKYRGSVAGGCSVGAPGSAALPRRGTGRGAQGTVRGVFGRIAGAAVRWRSARGLRGAFGQIGGPSFGHWGGGSGLRALPWPGHAGRRLGSGTRSDKWPGWRFGASGVAMAPPRGAESVSGRLARPAVPSVHRTCFVPERRV